MINEKLEETYNEVPYPSDPFPQTHPDRLATVATLFGLNPAPVEKCRVLELGCARGGNLIAMAYGLPESEFVGIDFAARQVAEGQKTVQALGLTNLRLEHRNILEIGPDFGQFDYVIAHGIYSWVPPEVQDKLLEVCRANLKPEGVAYVSYNVYPGYIMFEMVRGIMLYHTRNITDPLTLVAEARSFMNLLTEVMPEDDAYSNFIKVYTELRLTEGGEKYPGEAGLLHDELALINKPIYFYQFAQHAAAHGLQYLGEASFSTMLPDKFPPKVAEALAKLSKNIVEYEQYMDIARNRIFRETLLCHESVPLNRRIKPDWVRGMYMASPAKPVSAEPDIAGGSVEKFQAANGATFATDHPLTKAAMLHLGQVWPQPLQFEILVAAARTVLASTVAPARDGDAPKPGYDDAAVLAANLIKAYSYSSSLIDLTSHRPRFTLNLSEWPVASRLARFQAQQGRQVVANLRQQKVELDQLELHILSYLDGHHSQADLIELTAKLVVEGELDLKQEEQPVTEISQAREILTRLIEERLRWMARVGLLEG